MTNIQKERLKNITEEFDDEETIYPDEITGTLGRLLDEVDMPFDIQQEVEELYQRAVKLLWRKQNE